MRNAEYFVEKMQALLAEERECEVEETKTLLETLPPKVIHIGLPYLFLVLSMFSPLQDYIGLRLSCSDHCE